MSLHFRAVVVGVTIVGTICYAIYSHFKNREREGEEPQAYGNGGRDGAQDGVRDGGRDGARDGVRDGGRYRERDRVRDGGRYRKRDRVQLKLPMSPSSGLPTDCSICRDVVNNGSTANFLECGHVFHKLCIQTWLISNNSCPNCRHTL